ncbi:hypothetical protein M7I_0585 [Glarea lozoyensis 74030]|uniref:Uncharacterized protein n=1 Tax=Glarea lozoyensis (strain ATCC 74030 / MF5533) TaxID=1104152 RepID=H0EDX5_GLAL7|nr:hypothetical protein M7I_0585 [Glarea lozoyensis 74030]
MVSLWGKNDDEQADEVVSNNGGSSTHREAHPRPSSVDERTRLLPPPSREGYLSPDDPAYFVDGPPIAGVAILLHAINRFTDHGLGHCGYPAD